jgi:hypothetical protein
MSVVTFLQEQSAGPSGLMLKEILTYNDEQLEREHNYIQWLFPLMEESQQVHDAPVLTKEEISVLINDDLAIQNQVKAVERMLQFYRDTNHWLTMMDHNHLRITRILKSVRLLQSLPAAEAIYNTLMERVHEAGDPIQSKNLAYWTDAVGLSYRK